MSKWQSKEQLVQLLSSLVEIPSITGSEAEVILPDFVVEQLSDLQYFKQNPHHLQKSDRDGRYFVTALVKAIVQKYCNSSKSL